MIPKPTYLHCFQFYCQISNYSSIDKNIMVLFECLSEAKLNMSVTLTKPLYRNMKVSTHSTKTDKQLFYNLFGKENIKNKYSALGWSDHQLLLSLHN